MDGIAAFFDRVLERVRESASTRPPAAPSTAPGPLRHQPEVAAVLDRPVGPGLGPLGPAIHGSRLAEADRQVSTRRTRTIETRFEDGLATHDSLHGRSLLDGARTGPGRGRGSLASDALRR